MTKNYQNIILVLWSCFLWVSPSYAFITDEVSSHLGNGVLVVSNTTKDLLKPGDSIKTIKAHEVSPLMGRWQKEKAQRPIMDVPLANKKFKSFPELNAYTEAVHYDLWDDLAEFTKEYINILFKRDNKTQEVLDAATEVYDIIEDNQRFIDIIGGNEVIDLPVGIKQKVSPNSNITLGIVKMKYHPNYTEVDLFAKVELAELNVELFFGGSGIKISKEGGIYEEARLNLLADFPVGLNGGQWLITFKGGLDQKANDGNGDGQTYITINCEGKIKEMSLTADVRIAKTVAVPLNEDGTLKFPGKTEPRTGEMPSEKAGYLGASFKIQTESVEDLLIELDLPMFQLKALPNWGFKMEKAVLDLSDTKNATGIVFPELYKTAGLLVPGNENLWRGFHSKEVKITLPPEFKKIGSEERITIGAKDLFIDNYGVSGDFYATNVLNLNEGDAGKWQFSVDSIGVDLKVNRFIKAGFNGEIVLPISDEKSSGGKLAYKGLITSDQFYSVNMEVVEDVNFSIFKAKGKLFKESYVKLEVENNRFYPEANLTGLMSFDAEQEDQLNMLNSESLDDATDMEGLKFEGLSFQDFKIQTKERPYLQIGYAGFKDTIPLPKLGGFELGFYGIEIKTEKDDVAELGLNSYINLDESGIHGDVRLRIIGELVDGDYLKWRFKKVAIDSVEIDVKKKSFEFYGKLHFFRDNPLYGKGFAGQLSLLSEDLGIEVGAKGLFGAKDGYKYWFVDGHGIPTKSTNENFTIYDIGGGVYHHMRKSGLDERANSMSGIYYAPDKRTNLGFKALGAFEIKDGSTFTGLVAIEMSFNSKANGGGVSRIGFYGAASLLQATSEGTRDSFGSVDEMQQTVADKEASLANFGELSIDKEGIKYFATEVFPDILTGDELFAAQVAIDFDFRNRTYWGMFDVFLNSGAIKGEGQKNRLGYLEFYNSPSDWYIYVGTPTKRFGLRDIPIGPFKARVNLYFMTGTILEDPARPPQNVIDILHLSENEQVFNRNFNQELAQGTGYAFGAKFELGISYDWNLVYADVTAGVGFDLMMRDFGNAYCKGKEGPLGMDGWYATGQLYAYLQGKIGAQIKLFGIKKKVPILKAGIALLAQAQLPNPWFIKGYAGVDIKVLGVINIHTRLKIIIGEECEIMGKSGMQEITMISDISPREDSVDVDVFDAVQVAFNAPIGTEVSVEEDTGRKTYRIGLKELRVSAGSVNIQGDIEYNANKDLLSFKSSEILPPEQKINVLVRVSFEQRIGGNWVTVTENGQAIIEEKSIVFTTGKAPRKIPFSNIEYMYPVVDQQYMLPKESLIGYVQLDRGQNYLFGNGFSDELYFLDESGRKMKAAFNYDASKKRLNFTIPDLDNETLYTYALITLGPTDLDDQENGTKVTVNQVTEDVEISTNSIVGNASSGALISRLTYSFKTSRYNSFSKKIKAVNVDNYFTTVIKGFSDVGHLAVTTKNDEPFGVVDVVGNNYTLNKPLISAEGVMTDEYYQDIIYPLVYKNYPLDGDITLDRDLDLLGFPPNKSIYTTNTYRSYAQMDPQSQYLKINFPFRWHLAADFKSDFAELQFKIRNRYLNVNELDENAVEKYRYIMYKIFPFITRDTYRVKFKYVLPNQNSGNTELFNYKQTF